MSGAIINLILQIVAGALGGNAAGGFLKNNNIDLSPLAKTITGAAGGGIGGTILQGLIPALNSATSSGGVDVGVMLGNFVGGGVTGAIVTALYGILKSGLAKRAI